MENGQNVVAALVHHHHISTNLNSILGRLKGTEFYFSLWGLNKYTEIQSKRSIDFDDGILI
jgi:hypothetical protein